MILNLTDLDIRNACIPEDYDSAALMHALYNGHLDEAVAMIMEYEPTEIIVDIDEDFFTELREELLDIKVTMGKIHD